jgi:predicted phage-related endonuclease
LETIPKPEHGSLDWLRLRHRTQDGRIRFGASEAPILMGASKYETLTSLAIRKWSEPEVVAPNEAMNRGNLLEPALITYAEQVLQQDVFTPVEMFAEGRLIATLDGLSDDGLWIVEAKTTTAYSSDDELPADYFWQIIAQFACWPNAERALLVVLDKRLRLGSWIVNRANHAEQIERLLARAEEIGACLDQNELPPDASPTEDEVKRLYPNPQGHIELDKTTVAAIEMWQVWKDAREEAEAKEQQARDQIAKMLGSHEVGTVNGQSVVTFKYRKGSVRLDAKRLEADHPDLVAKYKQESQPTRVLRLTTGGNK